MTACFSTQIKINFLGLLSVFFISIQAKVSVHINSGDPAHPFPQFLFYENSTTKLGNIATHNPVGVSHAEMEKSIRDGYQIMMNRAEYPGGGVGNVKYIYYPSTPSCSEGTGYAMLAAAIMVDKPTFDGLWLWAHDNAMNLVKRYDNGQETSPGYLYSRLPGWQNTAGGNSAADGDFDMALALLIAYKQWGEFMGVNDSEGNPISYKKDLIEFLKGMTDTIPFASSNGKDLLSGDIGLDGYFKGGDTWTELTDWASENLPFNKPPNFKGPSKQYIDYTCPAYFREFADFLEDENPDKYAWNIYQFRRAEASSDWLMGKLLAQDPRNIPVAGGVSLSDNNEATFTSFNDGEDFRLAWRTILNYVWHGNPDFSWDPDKHQIIKGKSNSYERDIGKRFAKFLWDTRQSPWNNPGVPGTTGDYWGPHVLFQWYTPRGVPSGAFNLNWLHGTGAPSAITSQNFNLMAEMYRHTDIEWDIDDAGDGYLSSVPHYYHGIFKILGMTILTGNHQAPSKIKSIANMKVYLDIDKTFAYEGDTITYTIDYRNYGSKQAENVRLIDTLPKDFTFVSSTQGGQYNSGSHTVTWNIGTVPGVKTATGIKPTIGQVSLKIYIKNATKKQYANRVSISCSNGYGWTSNEYPNTISPVMKRNLVDIAKRALVIEKTTSSYKVNPKKDVIFSIRFLNSSEAGFINGGRSGIHFSYNHGGTSASEARHKMRIRMFHDAHESYVNYGNYRVSYYMFDPGRTGLTGVNGNKNGWTVSTQVLEGLQKDQIKILHQNITPGSDEHGKWNQRIILQFSDPTDPSIPDTNWASMGAPSRHLEKHHGSSNRIHRGQTAPLRVEWDIATSGGVMTQWDDDWSWDSKAGSAESQSLGFPITPDYTDPDPDKPGIPVNKLNPKHCHTIDYNVDNILIEEWDGYTWRRVFGTSPMPGRDIENVKIVDTIPPEFTFKEFVGPPPLGITPLISGNIITWEIPLLQINQGGIISYRATASDISPKKEKRVLNYSWIEGKNESPAFDTTVVLITTDSLPPPPLPLTTMYKNSDKKIYYNNDTVKYTISYKQTHGSIVSKPTRMEEWKLIKGDKKLPVDLDGTIEYAYDATEMVHQYAHGKNGILQGTFQQQPYHEFSLILRQSNNDYVEIWFKQEYADLSIQLFNSKKKIGPVHKITYPDFPKPFSFKIELKEDTAFIWIGDILSPLPGIVQTEIDVRHGYAGVKVINDIGEKLLNWFSHFDSGFDLVISDKLPYDIKLTKTSGSIVSGSMAGHELKHETDGKTLKWPVVNGTKPFLYNDSLSITVEGVVDTCNKPFIVNTAYANLYGHKRYSIGARNISIYGSGNYPVKLFADPPGGFYEDKVEVTLLASGKDIKIFYTTNGTSPHPSDVGLTTKEYKDPILLKKSTLITAIGLRKDNIVSDTLKELYEIIPTVIPVKLRASPSGGKYKDSVSVRLISSQKDITIIYTINGSMPDLSDIGKNTFEYKDPITVKKTTTITAIGLKNDSSVSNTLVESYTIEITVPRITPNSAWYHDNNGNGQIDAVSITFQAEPETLPDSIHLISPFDSLEKITVKQSDISLDNSSEKPVLTISLDKEFTFHGSTEFRKEKYGTLFGNEYSQEPFYIEDAVGPVIIAAKYVFEKNTDKKTEDKLADTLIIEFSEEVSPTTYPELFSLIMSMDPHDSYSFEVSQLKQTKSSVTYVVEAIKGVSIPITGDTIFINNNAKISDLLDNIQENRVNRPAILKVEDIPISIRVSVFPNPYSHDMDFLPKELLDGLIPSVSNKRGIIIEIDPQDRRVILEGEISLIDPINNVIAKMEIDEKDKPNMMALRDPKRNRLYYLWNGCNQYHRKVGNGTYYATIGITINNSIKKNIAKLIGIKHSTKIEENR